MILKSGSRDPLSCSLAPTLFKHTCDFSNDHEDIDLHGQVCLIRIGVKLSRKVVLSSQIWGSMVYCLHLTLSCYLQRPNTSHVKAPWVFLGVMHCSEELHCNCRWPELPYCTLIRGALVGVVGGGIYPILLALPVNAGLAARFVHIATTHCFSWKYVTSNGW